MMKNAWKDLAVKIDIREIESDQYFDQLDPKEFTLASISWIGDYADPMTFLDLWNSQSSLNRSSYTNKDYDGLLAQSNSEQGSHDTKH